MKKCEWLRRNIGPSGPYLCLCLSEKEYISVMKSIGVKTFGPWLNCNADATMHYLTVPVGNVAIICLKGWKESSTEENIGLLVHESVHVWQAWCDFYGEDRPGEEQEAYAVQYISQELIGDFLRRRKK